MTKQVELKYGRGTVTLDLSAAADVEILRENAMPVLEDVEQALLDGLEHPIGSAPLRELVAPGDRLTIVLSDLTRFWMRQDILCEALVRYLEGLGVRDEDIVVLIALGTHRKQTPEELEKLASSYVYRRCRVVNHDCDAADLADIGTTASGTRVLVNPLAVGRKVLVISGTVHHLMAGYGGGRKSVVPGIAGRETIRSNHRRALDPARPQTDSRVGSGRVCVNPINRDMEEAAGLLKPLFGVSVVVDAHSRHSGIFCGDFTKAWEASCRFCQKNYGVPIDYLADVVIASCNGYPKDINLYQSVKTLLNGVNAMKPGGTFVFLAQCPEGGGAPDFFDWIEPLGRGELDRALRESFTIGGYIFYASCEAIARAKEYYMLTDIAPEQVEKMGLRAYSDPDELMRHVDLAGKRVYVIPNGGSLLPQPREEYASLNAELAQPRGQAAGA
ncbi:MAG: nickel-dependent lactate racemase [Ruminococcaceae bacterium]|nr:nickel-dependent lactate racemase [Oscillospiraceae bacterium]